MIFQPHRFSRTKSHWRLFLDVFKKLDQIILLPTYAAGEKNNSYDSSFVYQKIKNKNKLLLKSIDEVKTAEVEITFDPPWTKDLMSEEAKLELGFLQKLMKNNLFIFFLALSVNLYSQESTPKDSLWMTKGNVALLLNQTGFSDWVGGGTNNFSGTIKFDYEWEYTNLGWNWLTNFESAYGLAKFKNAPFARKIDDRVLIQSIIGKEFSKNLSFSAFFNFTSPVK